MSDLEVTKHQLVKPVTSSTKRWNAAFALDDHSLNKYTLV